MKMIEEEVSRGLLSAQKQNNNYTQEKNTEPKPNPKFNFLYKNIEKKISPVKQSKNVYTEQKILNPKLRYLQPIQKNENKISTQPEKKEIKEDYVEINSFDNTPKFNNNEKKEEKEKDNKDYTIWEIIMTAPEDSDYNGGKYTVIAEFPLDYPMENPKFTFETEIYHCNVDKKNNLKVNWLMKGMKMEYILPRLLTLFYLQDPNVDENNEKCEKCELYKNNYDKFKENIKKSIKEQ
jgi:ubiquitin-protein ligase